MDRWIFSRWPLLYAALRITMAAAISTVIGFLAAASTFIFATELFPQPYFGACRDVLFMLALGGLSIGAVRPHWRQPARTAGPLMVIELVGIWVMAAQGWRLHALWLDERLGFAGAHAYTYAGALPNYARSECAAGVAVFLIVGCLNLSWRTAWKGLCPKCGYPLRGLPSMR